MYSFFFFIHIRKIKKKIVYKIIPRVLAYRFKIIAYSLYELLFVIGY